MSDDDHIEFRFEHGDLEIEIAGPRSVVEPLSRDILRDVGDRLPATTKHDSRDTSSPEPHTDPSAADSPDTHSDPSLSAPKKSSTPGKTDKLFGNSSPSSPPTNADPDLVWLVRCGELMQRIFMADADSLSNSAGQLHKHLRTDRLHSLYFPAELFDAEFQELADNTSTVWGKLTDAGRRHIDAADPDNP